MHLPQLLIVLALPVLIVSSRQGGRVERVTPNDNRTPSGVMRDGRLELRLDARLAMWHPDADNGPGALTPAFAAEDATPSIPGHSFESEPVRPLASCCGTPSPTRCVYRGHAPDSRLHQYYARQEERLGWQLARVATARQLARIIYAMLASGECWREESAIAGCLGNTGAPSVSRSLFSLIEPPDSHEVILSFELE